MALGKNLAAHVKNLFTSSLASARNSRSLNNDSAELCHHGRIHPFKKMSGRQRRSRGPPVAAPSGRAALRRNDQ